MRTLFLATALALVGCAPDPTLGTFDYTMNGTDTQTAPSSSTSTTAGGGVIVITTGKATDYLVTLAHADTTPCTFSADRNDKGDLISMAAGQTCLIVQGNLGATATLTSGTLTSTDKGETSTVEVSYSWTAQGLFGVNYAGTGKRTYVGKRR